jgi:hypothetical protein
MWKSDFDRFSAVMTGKMMLPFHASVTLSPSFCDVGKRERDRTADGGASATFCFLFVHLGRTSWSMSSSSPATINKQTHRNTNLHVISAAL